MPPLQVRPLMVVLVVVLATPFASAQGLFARDMPPERWGSVAAEIGIFGQGGALAYGQRELFGENADARFSVAYASQFYDGGSLGVEVAVTALSYTYRPDTSAPQLHLLAYGGVGPRLLVQGEVFDPGAGFSSSTAASLNVGAVGGLEARLQSVGVFLELGLSLPAVGVIGSRFSFFPLTTLTIPKLALGTNIYF